MRTLNENGTEIQNPNLTLGYLAEDSLFIRRHEAIEGVEEQGHYETTKEYPNGGKEIAWIVDVPAVEAKEAWDEYEDILRYVEYTKEELAEQKIRELKQNLFDTDYVAIKIAEGAATLDEYAQIVAQRAEWRAEINKLEAVLKAGQ